MSLHLSRRGYEVRIDSTLRSDSRFVIRAEIAYAAHLSREEWMRLSPMAQLELLLGIEGEELRGRRSLTAEVPTRESRRAGLIGRGQQPGLALGPVEEA